jgi:shikimate kinase
MTAAYVTHAPDEATLAKARGVLAALGDRAIVLVGMMGSGKSSIGRRLSTLLSLPFMDSDAEIEKAVGMSIADMFDRLGEDTFRDGERRTIAKLLGQGRQVLATGGGAFMDEQTREAIKQQAVSLWLKADTGVLLARVRRRNTRPLLKTADPEATLMNLVETRYPIYAFADITVESVDDPHDVMVTKVLDALAEHLGIAQAA